MAGRGITFCCPWVLLTERGTQSSAACVPQVAGLVCPVSGGTWTPFVNDNGKGKKDARGDINSQDVLKQERVVKLFEDEVEAHCAEVTERTQK